MTSAPWFILEAVDPSGASQLPPDPPVMMKIIRNSARLEISGDVSSVAHELILQQIARRLFPDQSTEINVDHGTRAPPGWALVTELVLRAIAQTESARASVSDTDISIEGLTSDPVAYAAAKQRIDAVLPEGMTIASMVTGMSTSLSYVDLCRNRFAQTISGGLVLFAISTADFGESALPLLDALVEIAVDCPDTTIRVTGFTDSTGNSVTNEALGLARAARVIDYMTSSGLPDARFEAMTAISNGAANQDADRRSRQLSRRVEFELLIP